jgi:hypothetical protein
MYLEECLSNIKQLEKIYNVCGGHFISMNFPLRNWEGYYACL